jgi:hypothetical protein
MRTKEAEEMRKVLGFGKFVLKVAFAGLILLWSFIMNCVGAIICAVSGD